MRMVMRANRGNNDKEENDRPDGTHGNHGRPGWPPADDTSRWRDAKGCPFPVDRTFDAIEKIRRRLRGTSVLPDDVLRHPFKLKFVKAVGTFVQVKTQFRKKFLSHLPVDGSREQFKYFSTCHDEKLLSLKSSIVDSLNYSFVTKPRFFA
jgi:hypothetical protein